MLTSQAYLGDDYAGIVARVWTCASLDSAIVIKLGERGMKKRRIHGPGRF